MAQTKYYFDPESCDYKKVTVSKKQVLLNALGYLSTTSVLALGFFFTYFTLYDSPKERILKEKNAILESNYIKLATEFKSIEQTLDKLEKNDDDLYCTILGKKPMDPNIRKGGTGGSNTYEHLDEINNSGLIKTTFERADMLKTRMMIQKQSYASLEKEVKIREHRMAHTPAISPVVIKDSRTVGSGFGPRMHPCLKARMPHNGLDFRVPVGTKIYATADGTVVKCGYDFGGGWFIRIKHGYGYQTKYLHCSQIKVRKGQFVKRGDCIALSGATGQRCAGPHVHYEVLINRKPHDPINYIFKNISPSQFKQIKALASDRDIMSMD